MWKRRTASIVLGASALWLTGLGPAPQARADCACTSTCVKVWYGQPDDKQFVADNCSDTGVRAYRDWEQVGVWDGTIWVGYEVGVGEP